jgi:hypothetical protein
MEKRHLVLINNERKASNVLSAKACSYTDICATTDVAHICAPDYCGYDYSSCGPTTEDYCSTKDTTV